MKSGYATIGASITHVTSMDLTESQRLALQMLKRMPGGEREPMLKT